MTKRHLVIGISGLALAFSILVYPGGSYARSQEQLIQLKQNLIIPDPSAETNYILAYIRSMQVDDEGNIYILDSKDLKVKVFNADGTYLRKFGTKGQGPGEFEGPLDLFIIDQTLSVFDFRNMRISRYSLDGHHLQDISLNELGLGGGFRPEAEDEAAVYGNLLEWKDDASVMLKLVKYDKKTKLISTISQVKINIKDPIGDKFILRTREDKLVIWTYPKNYVIYLISDDGNTIKKITKEYNPVKITAEDKERILNMKYGGKDKIPPDLDLVWPKYYSPINFLIVGDNHWLYVKTNEKNNRGEIKNDVFNEEGNFRGSFFHDHLESIWLIKNNMAYVVTEDIEGFPVVKRYEIIWNKRLSTSGR